MRTHNLGYPRIGSQRELKRACENFWEGKIDEKQLLEVGQQQRFINWQTQIDAGIDLIPCNDFSFYDQVLDLIVTFGVIPERFKTLNEKLSPTELYFALSRGYQNGEMDVTAMEMTKWFDTNYHYIVPEFETSQIFKLQHDGIIKSYREAKAYGVKNPKPVIVGPLSFLKLGKSKGSHFEIKTLISNLLPVYIELIGKLSNEGVQYIQIDEPFLCTSLSLQEESMYRYVLTELFNSFPDVHFILATYFDSITHNELIIEQLPKCTLHVDLARCPEQLDEILTFIPDNVNLSLGIVDGRNIWKNDFEKSLKIINKAIEKLGEKRLMLAPSCSLLHVPYDLDLETNEKTLPAKVKQWMAFARQKLAETMTLSRLASKNPYDFGNDLSALLKNTEDISTRSNSKLVHNSLVQLRLKEVTEKDLEREKPYPIRHELQQQLLNLPLFPTTTIGSFPQTTKVRGLRAKLKKGQITPVEYDHQIEDAIKDAIHWQEEIGLDVLVHGEFERNDMVEYFGEQLKGFAFTQNGWVQSYGSRCVKPPVIYGDVSRPVPMTVKWTVLAQSLTTKPMKGMLTGPVTILQWSFVRDDQPRSETAMQIALAIRDEVQDLERAGINIIQVDEPAIREGLPLRKTDWQEYLDWAVRAFKLSVTGAQPRTQIHTHMCYSEFNDIIKAIAAMDADVITIETSRSQMELLDAFAHFKYPNDIGPGVYDIHSPRVPSVDEIVNLLEKAINVIPYKQIWVNPDCGLKTRGWDETRKALDNMVEAANKMRVKFINI